MLTPFASLIAFANPEFGAVVMFASPIFRIWFISALLCWLVLFIPVAFVGFVLGMQLLQQSDEWVVTDLA